MDGPEQWGAVAVAEPEGAQPATKGPEAWGAKPVTPATWGATELKTPEFEAPEEHYQYTKEEQERMGAGRAGWGGAGPGFGLDDPVVPLGDFLIKGPGEAKTKLEEGVNTTLRETLNGLMTPKSLGLMLASMGVATTGAMAARLVSGIWTGYMGYHAVKDTPEIARKLGEEMGKPEGKRDMEKIGQGLSQLGVTATFFATPAVHTFKPKPNPAAELAKLLSESTETTDLTQGRARGLRGARTGGEVDPAALPDVQPDVRNIEDMRSQDWAEAINKELDALDAREAISEIHAGEAEPTPAPAEPRGARPEVPETLPEAERGLDVIEEIRQKGARTVRDIQRLFPLAELKKEQARALRNQAWPKEGEAKGEAAVPAEPSGELPAAPVEPETPPSSSQGEVGKAAPGANVEEVLRQEQAKAAEQAKADREAATALLRGELERLRAKGVSVAERENAAAQLQAELVAARAAPEGPATKTAADLPPTEPPAPGPVDPDAPRLLSSEEVMMRGRAGVEHIMDKFGVGWNEALAIRQENRDRLGIVAKVPADLTPKVEPGTKEPAAAPETTTVRSATLERSTDERKGSGMTAETGETPARVAAATPEGEAPKGKARRISITGEKRPPDVIDEIEGRHTNKIDLRSARLIQEDFKPRGAARKLFKGKGGMPVDELIDDMRRSGYFPEHATEGDLLDAINAAADSRKSGRKAVTKEQKILQEEERQHVEFRQDIAKKSQKTETIVPEDLNEGDKFTLRGVQLEVTRLEFDEDGRVTMVELDDGQKYGTQEVGANTVLRMDKGSLKAEPRAEPDFDPATGEPFSLDPAESVEEQKARMAQEEEQRAAQARQEQLAEGAAAPLVGSVGDIGQADLLGGGGDLFSGPGPKTFAMSGARGRQLRTAVKQIVPPTPLPAAITKPGSVAPVKSWWARQHEGFQSIFSPQNISNQSKWLANVIRATNAKAALDLVRAGKWMEELQKYFDKTPVPRTWTYDRTKPLPFNYAVMDALERNRSKLPKELQDFARELDKEYAWRIALIRQFKPEAMAKLITDYFPHIWERPEAGALIGWLSEVSKAPFEGSKAFMNQRTLPSTVDGLAKGLRPISDNPVDLNLAKLHQIDKFLKAAKIMQEAEAQGMLKYYPLGKTIPEGITVVKDPAFTVYAPPHLQVREAYDAGIRLGLIDFIKKMGWNYQRVAKLGVNRWGQYTQGGKIEAQHGAPDFVIMHEIGHGLDERYDLYNVLTQKTGGILRQDAIKAELKDLADLRSKGGASREFKKYAQTPEEQIANAVHAYIYAPEAMSKTAPVTQRALAEFIEQHPELHDLKEIKPGLEIGSEDINLPLPGPVLAGHWTLPDAAAKVLTNYLSPGLGKFGLYRTLRSASNILNGAQLGMSAFHAGFTSVDAIVNSVAVGMGYALRGDLPKAARSIGTAPLAPVMNYYLGKAVQRMMVDPKTTTVPVLDFPALAIKGFEMPIRNVPLVQEIARLAVEGGLRADIDPFWKTNITRNLLRAVREGGIKNYAKAGFAVPWALVEQSMRPIAEHLVPRQKLGVFSQLAIQEMDRIGWNAHPDQVRASMARAADWTEDRMGQMTYDNLFYNRAVKDIALLGFRAYGWQLGKYRHMYGSVADTGRLLAHATEKAKALAQGKTSTTPPLEITNRMLYPVALVMVSATIGAIVNRLLSGQWPQELRDYTMPRNGQLDKHGRPARLVLPTYMKDMMSDWHDIPNLKKMGESFYHKLNPGIAAVTDMFLNKDYYGVEIFHSEDPFQNILADLGKHAAKQFVPFSVSGTMKLHEEEAPLAQLVLPFFGIVPAKKALTMTPAEVRAADITRDRLPVGARTREQADHSEMLRTLVKDMKARRPGLDMSKVRMADLDTIKSMLTMTPLQYQIHKMGPEDAMHVWRLANPQEREMLRIPIAIKLGNSQGVDPEKMAGFVKELGLGQPAAR